MPGTTGSQTDSRQKPLAQQSSSSHPLDLLFTVKPAAGWQRGKEPPDRVSGLMIAAAEVDDCVPTD